MSKEMGLSRGRITTRILVDFSWVEIVAELICPISWQSNRVIWVTRCEVCWNDYGASIFDGIENDEMWMYMYPINYGKQDPRS